MKTCRILAMLLCLTLLPVFSVSGTEAESMELNTSETVADAILGGTLQSSNFESVEMGTSQGASVVQRGGVNCWLLDIAQGNNKAYMNFVFEESFKSEENDGSEYLFEIEYFDSGNGYCRLFYDALDSDKKDGGTIYTNNTGQWQTAAFTVQDGSFQNGVDGQYDFQLTIKARSTRSPTSGASIAVRRVTVTKIPAKNPIYLTATNDEIGHTYKWYEESKIIHNKLENLTDQSITVDVNYRLISAEEVVPFERTETLTFAPREVKEFDLDFGEVQRCDIYRYEVTVKNEDAGIDSSFMPFEATVLKTDPDGILNENVMFAAHFDRYPIERARDGIAMLKMSNASGIRIDFAWSAMERTAGELVWENHTLYDIVECMRENGLSLLPILDSAPVRYGLQNWNEMPWTEEQLEAWARFARYSAEVLDGMTDTFEIWNEPNITSFNMNLGTPQGDGRVYAKMAEVAAEAIREVIPNAKIGGPSVTNISQAQGQDYFRETMESEVYNYLDVIVLHPYIRTAPENSAMPESIQWYKDQYAAAGFPDPDIWNTETGYTVGDEGITEEVKGMWNSRAGILYRALDLGDINVFYNFEKKGTIATDREDQFGHVSGGYDECIKYGKYWVPTISYVMVAGHNYIMAQSESEGVYDSEDKNIRIAKFKSDKFDTNIVTLYAVEGTETVTLRLGADKVTVYDAKGNPTEVAGKDGVFTFTADQSPQYIMGDVQTVELLDTPLVSFDTHSTVVAEGDVIRIGMTKMTDADLTAEVSAPSSCAVLETTEDFDPVTGRGAVVIRNRALTDTAYQVEIRLRDSGGTLVQTATVDVAVGVTVDTDLSVALLSNSDATRWEATMSIKNYSSSRALKGYVEFQSPSDFAAVGKVDFGAVTRGNTGQITFALPKLSRLGQYTVEYDIVIDTGERYSFQSKVDFTVAGYAYEKPVIDGILDDGEWNLSTAMYADQADQIVALMNDWSWQGANDLSARSSVMWDEENMYLMAEVMDDVHYQPNSITGGTWNGDSMQFGVFYGDESFLAIGQASTTFNEINLSLSPEGPGAYRTLSQDNFCEPGICTDAEVAITRQGNRTVYELRMPWNSLLRPGDQPKEGDLLGYSFLFNENDGSGRCGWIEYASGIGLTKDTTLFTYLKLIK